MSLHILKKAPIDPFELTPALQAPLPRVYRLNYLACDQLDVDWFRFAGLIYTDQACFRIRWSANSAKTDLAKGDWVSPKWITTPTRREGTYSVSGLTPIRSSDATVNLFHLVPGWWVQDESLVKAAAVLIDNLPVSYRALFNEVLWSNGRFGRYCTVPSSMKGHHNGLNGNLRHSVQMAQMVPQLGEYTHMSNPDLLVLACLLHDCGKADEYCMDTYKQWRLTDRGRLLGHGVTIVEWVAQARANTSTKMPEKEYQALVHILTCSRSAPAWLGIRKPAFLEADLLSILDHISGADDLMDRNSPESGWGSYHPHLGTRPYRIGSPISTSI